LLLGFNAQVIQLILFRETLFLSNGSELSLGICLAAWALFNGAGSFAGRAAEKKRLAPGRIFNGLLLFMPLFLAVSVHAARGARALVDVPGAEPLRMAYFSLLAVLVLAPITFIDGFMFVSAMDALFSRKRDGNRAPFVYGVESMGSLAGGVLFTFLFVTAFDPFAIAGVLCCMNCVLLPFKKHMDSNTNADTGAPGRRLFLTRMGARAVFLCIGVAAVLFGPDMNRVSEEKRWSLLQPDLDLIESIETRYQNLAVLKCREDSSFFGNGHLLFTLRSFSVPDLSEDWNLGVFPNFAMLLPENPEKVLMVGGGSRGYLRDILEHGPSRVDWVEYDAELVKLIGKHRLPEANKAVDDPVVRFFPNDGRYFVKSVPAGSNDLIIVDVPDPANANLNRYYTKEFFEECREALAESGVLIIGMSCQPNYIGDEMRARNGSVYAALKEVFSEVIITPGTFSFMAASCSKGVLTADPEELVRRNTKRGLKSERFSPYLFHSWFEADDVERVNSFFEAALDEGLIGANLDDRPAAYFADSALFSRMTSEHGDDRFLFGVEEFLSGNVEGAAAVAVYGLCAFFPGFGLLLLIFFSIRALKGGGNGTRRTLLFLTAASTGFSGIVLEMGILIKYQNCSGHLYSRMGLLIASYMAGLALGSLAPAQKTRARASLISAVLFMAAGLAAAVLLLPMLADMPPGGIETTFAFAAVTLLFGASGGLAFRGVSLALGGDSGGMIYTMDILGTCLGGWQAASILIPALGVRNTLIVAAAAVMLLCTFSVLALGKRLVVEAHG